MLGAVLDLAPECGDGLLVENSDINAV